VVCRQKRQHSCSTRLPVTQGNAVGRPKTFAFQPNSEVQDAPAVGSSHIDGNSPNHSFLSFDVCIDADGMVHSSSRSTAAMENNFGEGPEDDFHIQPKRPILDVEVVVSGSVCNRGVAS
jgi:hypothetical protein